MSKDNANTDFQKALQLLPWYAKNSLSGDDMSWVKQQLKLSPELQSELALIKKQMIITDQYVEALDTQEFENQSTRINALKNRIKRQTLEQEQESLKSAKNKQKGGETMWEKILSFLPQTQGQWKFASAVALTVMVIQGVVISQLYRTESAVEYSTLSATNTPDNSIVLLAGFKKDTSLAQMEVFLNKNNLRIIGGPDGQNQYRLGFRQINIKGKAPDEEEISELVFDLLDNQIIDFVLRED
jgi:hypothetical protein